MTGRRWLNSAIRAAARSDAPLPWQRGAPRAAWLSRRHSESAKAKLPGA